LFFWEKTPFSASNWRKSKKIVIITSSPDVFPWSPCHAGPFPRMLYIFLSPLISAITFYFLCTYFGVNFTLQNSHTMQIVPVCTTELPCSPWKLVHPGGIRTPDLLFIRRMRWPLRRLRHYGGFADLR
jgi:hypothetical protein